MVPRLALVTILLTACGTDTPPASLSLEQLDEVAAEIQDEVAAVDEAFCDAGGGDPMANCYVGIATADLDEATSTVCDSVLPIVEERTSGTVTYFAFDSRNDDVIGVIDCP